MDAVMETPKGIDEPENGERKEDELEMTFVYPDRGGSGAPGTEYYERFLAETIDAQPGFRVRRLNIPFGLRGLSLLRFKPGPVVIMSGASGARQFFAAAVARLSGRKVLIVHHHFSFREYKGWRRAAYRMAEMLFLHTATRIIVPGTYMHAELQESFLPERLILLKIPIERGAVTEVYPEPDRLAYVGAVEPRKGLIYLLQSLALLKARGKEVHLDIMGPHTDPVYLRQLKEFAGREQLDITFHGYVSAERKDDLLRRAWLFAFPSLLEGFGIPLAEAQRYGLPTVCFDNSAMPYTVKNGINGLVCPDRDSEAMARAISRLLEDTELRARLSSGAAAAARTRFNADDFRKEVARALRDFLRTRK